MLARDLQSRADLDALRDALPGVPVAIVRLEVPHGELERRIRARDTGAELEQHLGMLAEPPVDLGAATVRGDLGSPREVALAVLAASGRG